MNESMTGIFFMLPTVPKIETTKKSIESAISRTGKPVGNNARIGCGRFDRFSYSLWVQTFWLQLLRLS